MVIWHAGNIISNVISGLLAAAVLANMDELAGLASWRWFFILECAVSILVEVLGFFCLSNFPNNSPNSFNGEQSQMAQYRMLVSAGGVAEDDGDYWGGFRMACKDPFTWAFAALDFAIIVAQSFKDFFLRKILATLGFNETTTYLLQAPSYVVTYMVTLIIS
ncbi:hypothetical protein S40285_08732 [Stachybotrys chlorohalonatus IBT 40285]|uniref:Major facilitator superfamily (MFS) profile domain-containing protein n=1 Tax=Stachybotrys chlorohalonatus (strain IBT 40285) TaxID=1283841 RepID=A0A084R049_STAC4|nr:hypothetical protein S40285_08732 [Stachybotrys chlorohalonata IBT 40285]